MKKLELGESGSSCAGFGLLAVVLICGMASTSARALLVSTDSDYGVGTLTYDTDTGLEWLSPSLGLSYGGSGCCYSYNDINGQFGSGGVFEGYRYATAAELQTLFFTSAGIDLGTPGSDNAVGSLISLMGDTFNEYFDPVYSFFATTGFYDLGDGNVGIASLEAELFFGEWDRADAYISGSSVAPDENYNGFGSWLVRDAVSTTDSGMSVSVDEPGTFLFLLLSGVFGVALRQRWLARA